MLTHIRALSPELLTRIRAFSPEKHPYIDQSAMPLVIALLLSFSQIQSLMTWSLTAGIDGRGSLCRRAEQVVYVSRSGGLGR